MSSQDGWFVVEKITLFQNIQGVGTSESMLMQNSESRKSRNCGFPGPLLAKGNYTIVEFTQNTVSWINRALQAWTETNLFTTLVSPNLTIFELRLVNFPTSSKKKSSCVNKSMLTSTFVFLSPPHHWDRSESPLAVTEVGCTRHSASPISDDLHGNVWQGRDNEVPSLPTGRLSSGVLSDLSPLSRARTARTCPSPWSPGTGVEWSQGRDGESRGPSLPSKLEKAYICYHKKA